MRPYHWVGVVPRGEKSMTDHAFQIGQMVDYKPRTRLIDAVPGRYEITRRMPFESGEFRYRIKSSIESHERMVNESELKVAW
jgi:hypothetical protein